jgi:hypothetical protein
MTYKHLGYDVGKLVEEKQVQYGDSVGKSARILETLFPSGIPVHSFPDALLIVRILDKLSRLAQRGPEAKDLGGESPWRDIAGYGLLGLMKDEKK